MSIVELLSLFSDPQALKNLSMSQKMVASLVTTLLGMGITFLSLVALQVVVFLMAKFIHERPAEKEADSENTVVKDTGSEEIESQEVVAAISASLAVVLQRSPHGLIIKNIKKVEDAGPVWSKVGMFEQMDRNVELSSGGMG